MKKLLCLLLCVLLMLSVAACGNNTPDTTDEDNNEGVYTDTYVRDPQVNAFILDFMKVCPYTMIDIHPNNQTGEFIGYVNQCEVIMYPSDQGVAVSIIGGDDEAARDRMLGIFAMCIKATDPSLSDEVIEETVQFVQDHASNIRGYQASQNLHMLGYITLTDEPTVSIDCRLDMLAIRYLPESAE